MTEENKEYLENYQELIIKYLDYLITSDTSVKVVSTFKYKSITFHLHNYCKGIINQTHLERFIRRYVSHLCSHYIDLETGEHIIPDLLKYRLGEEVDLFLVYDSTNDKCILTMEEELQFDFHPLSEHRLMALKKPEHYIAESFFSFYYAYHTETFTGIELLEFTGNKW